MVVVLGSTGHSHNWLDYNLLDDFRSCQPMHISNTRVEAKVERGRACLHGLEYGYAPHSSISVVAQSQVDSNFEDCMTTKDLLQNFPNHGVQIC